jgi:hypothetical protein
MSELRNKHSTYPKVAVQWLNQALCPARAGFSAWLIPQVRDFEIANFL